MFHVVLIAALLLVSGEAHAQSGNASPAQPAPTTAGSWWERITFFGDFRARYEGFFADDLATRQRGRYRLRFGLRTAVAEGLALNLRLASGDAGDVASTNQTLTDFFTRKPLNIDQAALTYTPRRARALTFGVGKFGYPVTRTQMVWDDDVNWEGVYEQLSLTRGATTVRVVGVQSPLQDVAAGQDAFMFGHFAQLGTRTGAHRWQLSIANYAFQHADQLALALEQRSSIRAQQTNAVRRNAEGRVVGYQSGFNLVDVIAQATFDTGRPEYPFSATADFVVNTRAATDEDRGIWLVGTYGRAAAVKTYAVSHTYARVERDAVLSAFNFSDMGPATNVVMHMTAFSFMPKPRLNLDAIAILTRLLEPQPGARNPLLKRIQVDARVTF
jgi:hypothetical protein